MKQFGLSKSERIKHSKEIKDVYSAGKVYITPSRKLKAVYKIDNGGTSSVKAAFAVSKRAGNAVWRNRLKRIMREAYRLNKTEIIESAASSGNSALIIFSPGFLNQKKNKKVSFNDIVDDMNIILKRVSGEIKSTID